MVDQRLGRNRNGKLVIRKVLEEAYRRTWSLKRSVNTFALWVNRNWWKWPPRGGESAFTQPAPSSLDVSKNRVAVWLGRRPAGLRNMQSPGQSQDQRWVLR